MSWLDALLVRGNEAMQLAAPAARIAPADIISVWVQTRPPRDSDPGAGEVGWYSVADGVVTMHDEDGRPTRSTYRLRSGDDARGIASRLTLEAWRKARGETDFNRPLRYPASGIC